jgi:hypothetical protein
VITRILVWLSVVLWAIWVGGQTYHALMVVPVWSADPVVNISKYRELTDGQVRLPFFLLFSTAWPTLLAGAALVGARRLPWSQRWYLVAFTVCALLITLALMLWLAPAIRAVFGGQFDSQETVRQFRMWETGNTIRLALEFGVLLLGLRALIACYEAVPPLSSQIK